MSELQISLLAIGALVIVAVVAYNKLQERKIARGTEDRFRSRHEDVLLNRSRSAASDNGGATHSAGFAEAEPRSMRLGDGDESVRIEPMLHAPKESSQVADLAPAATAIDYVIGIEFETPVGGDLISSTSELAVLHRAGWEGLDAETMLWQKVHAGAQYQRARGVLQIVSRQGMIQQRDLEAFTEAVFDTAQRLGGTATAEDAATVLVRARELDAFCGDVDVQIAIHLVSRDGVAFAGTKLRGLAEAAGMALGADRQFSFRDEDGRVVFSMANKEEPAFQSDSMREISTRGVSLLLDVPRAPGGVASFRAMVLAAQRLSQSLNAAIIDDNGNPLADRSFEAIAAQLAVLYRNMDERGIAAGSPTALRLFS
jgi:hypothetical protein